MKKDEVYEVRYGMKAMPNTNSTQLSAEAITERLFDNIFKGREKKTEKAEKKEEPLTPREFFVDVLDLPKWMRKKKHQVEDEKVEMKEEEVKVETKAIVPTCKIKSIYGQECNDVLKWQFEIKS